MDRALATYEYLLTQSSSTTTLLVLVHTQASTCVWRADRFVRGPHTYLSVIGSTAPRVMSRLLEVPSRRITVRLSSRRVFVLKMSSGPRSGSSSLLCGLIPSALTILTISTLIGLTLFLAAEVWLAPHHVAKLITATGAAAAGGERIGVVQQPHQMHGHAELSPVIQQGQSQEHMVAALSQSSSLNTKQLARARQDLFCSDVHPVTLSGRCAYNQGWPVAKCMRKGCMGISHYRYTPSDAG